MANGVHTSPCKTPSTWFKKEGTLWLCQCGQIWVIRWHDSMLSEFKKWEQVTLKVER